MTQYCHCYTFQPSLSISEGSAYLMLRRRWLLTGCLHVTFIFPPMLNIYIFLNDTPDERFPVSCTTVLCQCWVSCVLVEAVE